MPIINLKNIFETCTFVPKQLLLQFYQKRQFFEITPKRKQYHGRKLIGYSREQMYDVVTDIGNYKYFLPFCKKSDILTREESKLSAYLEIGFPPVMESYISDVTFQRPHVTSAVCHDGRLFTYLVTTWKFNPGLRSNANSSIVDFAVDFEFKSFFHSNLANMFFDRLVKQMENAFLVEAKRRYGKESVPTHKLTIARS